LPFLSLSLLDGILFRRFEKVLSRGELQIQLAWLLHRRERRVDLFLFGWGGVCALDGNGIWVDAILSRFFSLDGGVLFRRLFRRFEVSLLEF
jgi:hypothetical protein